MDKIDLHYVDLVPGFIRRDRNGYALARAIAWAVEQFCADMEQADAFLTDPECMPEWALDEFAYNHGMEWYDRTASVEVKRCWVRDADYMRYVIGTKEAVRHLLLGFYNYVNIEEWFQYSGKPFVFRVFVSGDTSEALEEWGRKSTNIVKNLRSIFGAFAQTSRESLHFAQRDSFYLITYGFPDTSTDREQDISHDAVQTGYYHAHRLDAGVHDVIGYAEHRIPGDIEAEFGATGLKAEVRHKATFHVFQVSGDVESGEADVSANDGDMHTGEQWKVGFIDFLFCGNPDVL